MTTFTEGNHDAEFIISEANFHRSRDNAEVASGQNLAAGTVVGFDGSNRLIAWTGDTFTDGETDTVAGIIIAATDASTAVQKAALLARDAEVNIHLLTYPAAKEHVMIASLKLNGIIVRE